MRQSVNVRRDVAKEDTRMDLIHEVTTQLDQLLAQGPLLADRLLTCSDRVRKLEAVIVAVERLAVSVREVRVTIPVVTQSPAVVPPATPSSTPTGPSSMPTSALRQLRRLCDQLAVKLSYLNEPINVVEIDQVGGVGQLRSVAPANTPPNPSSAGPASRPAGLNSSRYFEILVETSGSIRVCRYEKLSGQPRDAIPATLTREVFLQLVQDLWQAT